MRKNVTTKSVIIGNTPIKKRKLKKKNNNGNNKRYIKQPSMTIKGRKEGLQIS